MSIKHREAKVESFSSTLLFVPSKLVESDGNLVRKMSPDLD